MRLRLVDHVAQRARPTGAEAADGSFFSESRVLIVDNRGLQGVRSEDQHRVAAATDSNSLVAEGDLNPVAASLCVLSGRIYDNRVPLCHNSNRLQLAKFTLPLLGIV